MTWRKLSKRVSMLRRKIQVMSAAETTARKHRGRPFQRGISGNPTGRPVGSRHKSCLAAEALLEGEAEALTRKAVEMALAGNVLALRLCMERLLPPRRERVTTFALPALHSAADATTAMAAILAGIAAGELTIGEAAEFAKLVEASVVRLDAAKQAERKDQVDRLFPGLDFGSHPVR
jgi:hypothetical protein